MVVFFELFYVGVFGVVKFEVVDFGVVVGGFYDDL